MVLLYMPHKVCVVVVVCVCVGGGGGGHRDRPSLIPACARKMTCNAWCHLFNCISGAKYILPTTNCV